MLTLKLIVPDYYRDFTCLAGSCRHTCCKGWEIDIDNDTLTGWGRLPEPLRTDLARGIEITEDGARFALQGEEERCPMLREDGLCRLIAECGEAALCDICRDHPRFRCEYTGRTEMGLGLCCESAARLILLREKPMQLTVLKDDGAAEKLPAAEEEFFILRRQLLKQVTDRRMPITSRIYGLYRRFGLPFNPDGPFADWARFLLTLEYLDAGWHDRLRKLITPGRHKVGPAGQSWTSPAFEQLAVYLLYRHMAPAADGVSLPRQLTLCLFFWTLVRRLCGLWEEENGPLTQDAFLEICRQFSSELEYSDENPDKILARLYPEK